MARKYVANINNFFSFFSQSKSSSYSGYGYDQPPLGQVVNIVDNQNTLEKHSRTSIEGGKTQIPGSNGDNSVQVQYHYHSDKESL